MPQRARDVDVARPGGLQPPRRGAVQLAPEATDGGLELALIARPEVEHPAQRDRARRRLGRRGRLHALLALHQRAQQLRQRRQDLLGARGDRLDEPLVDLHRAQLVEELLELGRRDVDGELLRAALLRHPARRVRACAADAELVGHALHRLLEGVLAAREHELGAEDGEPQALGLAVHVGPRADLILLEEAAKVRRRRLVVGVALVLERVPLEVLAEAQLGRGHPAVAVGVAREPRRRRPRRLDEPEVEVEEPVEGLGVLARLDERGAQRVADHLAVGEPDLAQRPHRVEPLRRGHAQPVAAQQADELDEDPLHARPP